MSVTPSQPQEAAIRSSLNLSDPGERDLVTRFVARLPRQVVAIRAAEAIGDYQTLRRVLHQMKGSAGSYGFASLTAAAAAAERAIDTQQPSPEIAQLTSALLSLIVRVEGYGHVPEQSAA